MQAAASSENITDAALAEKNAALAAGTATTTADNSDADAKDPEAQLASGESGDEALPRDVTGIRWIIIVIAILSSTFLFALDNTVVADVQPQLVLQFDGIDRLAWLSVAFIMAAVSMNLLLGQLFSQLLPKWLYIGGVVVFEVGSVVCGAAPSMNALIIGRALCGLGGVAMYLGVMVLLSATTTIKERPMYIAGIGVTWGIGTILGPVVGGAFAESSATWRWAFYINLVIGAVAAPVYLFMLPSPDPRPGVRLMDRLKEVDFIGAVIFVGAVVSFIMAINFGGILYDWNSGSEIALWVVAGVLFLAFGLQQAFCIGTTPKRRHFPAELITDPNSRRTVLILFCTTAAGGAGIFVPVYFVPLFFQFTRGDSAVEAAVRLLPFICVLVFVTLVQGALLSHPSGRFGFYMPWFLVGGLLAITGAALMYRVESTTSEAWVYGATALTAAGVASFAQSGFAIAQASVPLEKGAMAAALIALGQSGGITISLAVANSVFVNTAKNRLMDILPGVGEEQIEVAIAGLGADFVKALNPELQAAVLDAIVDSISRCYILLIAAGGVSVVGSLLMKRETISMMAAAGGG